MVLRCDFVPAKLDRGFGPIASKAVGWGWCGLGLTDWLSAPKRRALLVPGSTITAETTAEITADRRSGFTPQSTERKNDATQERLGLSFTKIMPLVPVCHSPWPKVEPWVEGIADRGQSTGCYRVEKGISG